MALPTKVTIPNRYSTTPLDFTWTAAPTTETAMVWTPGDIFLAWNTSADTAYTVTVTSNPKYKRGTDVITAFSMAFGDFTVFPRFPGQDDETLLVHASNAAVKFARIGTRSDPA